MNSWVTSRNWNIFNSMYWELVENGMAEIPDEDEMNYQIKKQFLEERQIDKDFYADSRYLKMVYEQRGMRIIKDEYWK